ncbi:MULTISPECIES: PP2C family protein-serine/threonine phosphatase [Nocardioides]|uniref:PP2C family protein-serine/threonine phosphatase n=1 Tax=Nocardioides vastitatis TaxID=2568655 RepID=A0ABW0Z991_9ACTN|nr:SpoIIE family protein phosphatase [Nocardioides sp.]THJ02373.1 PAS domain-containing protein [Nocardioides sp.]
MEEVTSAAFHDALLVDDPVALYDRAPCGYLSTTPDGVIVKVNATFCSWVGHDASTLVGRRLSDLLTVGSRIYHETHYAPMLRLHGRIKEVALDLVRQDRTRLPVLLNAVLERDVSGRPLVARLAVFDATDRRRYERDLVTAKEAAEAERERSQLLLRTLQQSFIPPAPPSVPDLEVSAAFHPADSEIGGDFYDIFPIGPQEWYVLLGDVCGKGAEAAVVTSLVRHTVRGLSVLASDPVEVLGQLNEVVLRSSADRFCTLVLGRLVRRDGTWEVTLASAGHPTPLLCTPGEPPRPVGGSGPLLGVLEDPVFAQETFLLRPGHLVLLYTDGITEARSQTELYGDDRLAIACARWAATPQDLIAELTAEALSFATRGRDDIAVLAFGASASP